MSCKSGSRVARPPSTRIAVLAAFGLLSLASPGFAASIEERLTVCLACHGPGGQSRVPGTPSLGGQPQFFVVAQLFLSERGAGMTLR